MKWRTQGGRDVFMYRRSLIRAAAAAGLLPAAGRAQSGPSEPLRPLVGAAAGGGAAGSAHRATQGSGKEGSGDGWNPQRTAVEGEALEGARPPPVRLALWPEGGPLAAGQDRFGDIVAQGTAPRPLPCAEL